MTHSPIKVMGSLALVFLSLLVSSNIIAQGEFLIKFSDDCTSFQKVGNTPINDVEFVTQGFTTFDESQGIFYFIGGPPSGTVYGVDASTGAVVSSFVDGNLTAIEYAAFGKILGIRRDVTNGTKTFVHVDPITGSTIELGPPILSSSSFQGYDSYNELDSIFTFTAPPNTLFSYNGVTGALLHSPALQNTNAQTIHHYSYSNADGKLYGVLSENQGTTIFLIEINISDGSFSKIGPGHAIAGGTSYSTIDEDSQHYIYHYRDGQNFHLVKLDLVTGAIVSDTTITLDQGDNVGCLEYDNVRDELVAKHWDSDFMPSLTDEICDNGIDDDGDGAIDCEDIDLVNDCCCQMTTAVSLQDYAVCEGTVIVLEAETDYTGVFFWYRDGNLLSETGKALEVTVAGNYTVSFTDDCGNVSEAISTVIIEASTAISLPLSYAYCEGIGGTITATTIAGSVNWYFNGDLIPNQNAPTLAVTEAGDYTVVASAGTACESQATTTVTLSQGGVMNETHYLCEGGSVVVNGSIYTLPGIYSVVISTGSDCDDILNFEIIELPIVRLQDSFEICEGEAVVIDGLNYFAAGNYTLRYPEPLGGCDTVYNFSITHLPVTQVEKFVQITEGNPVTVNGVSYDEEGQYIQNIPALAGCDTVCIVNVLKEECLASYNFDACYSSVTLGAHDYSEFVAEYPNVPSCGTLVASNFIRVDPVVNKHSCTEGLNASSAICISSEEGCAFLQSSPKAGRISLAVRPEAGQEIMLSRLTFYQMAPSTYQWSHSSGPNNYPTKFGVSITQEGTEVFRAAELNTTADWSFAELLLDESIIITEDSNLEIQILGYCLVGNGAAVSAFDLEDVKIYGGCRALNSSRILAGTVSLRGVQKMEEVQLTAFGNDQMRMTSSDSEGSYAFTHTADEVAYQLAAEMDENYLAGVSTLDLIKIQRHILGLELLPSPLDHIAADVNNNGQIDGLDLVELRKLILGIYTELPANDSYRFFEKQSVVDAHTVSDLLEKIQVNEDGKHYTDLDFIGVKIGDVNGAQLAKRANQSMEFVLENQELVEGGSLTVPFVLAHEMSLTGFETTIAFNPELLSFSHITSRGIDLDDHNLGLTKLKEGLIKISWNNLSAESYSKGVSLFELEFTTISSGWLNTNLELSTETSEAYDTYLDVLPLKFSYTAAKQNEFTLHQNIPNPFTENTEIIFTLPLATEIILTIHEVDGRVVSEQTVTYEAGTHSILIDANKISGSGIFFYKLETDYGTAFKKMILAR